MNMKKVQWGKVYNHNQLTLDFVDDVILIVENNLGIEYVTSVKPTILFSSVYCACTSLSTKRLFTLARFP